MKLILKPYSTDVNYQALFKEPAFSLAESESRIALIQKILKYFGLRLNDIKFNDNLPSNNYVHFYKFFNKCFFDASIGLEEVAARVGTPVDEAQVVDLLSKFCDLFKDNSITFQKLNIQRHFETDGDVESYLQSLNSTIPRNFQNHISGRGVIYNLSFQKHHLNIQIVITNSALVKNGIYLFVEFVYSPNQYDFDDTVKVTLEKYNLILNELKLTMANED